MPKASKKPVEEPVRRSQGLMTAAWYSGQSARTNKRERVVPETWKEFYSKEWLAGYDGTPLAR